MMSPEYETRPPRDQGTILLRRTEGTTHEQFVDHHRNVHAALFSALPEVKQYVRRRVQSHATGDPLPEIAESHLDGATEFWIDDLAGLSGMFQSTGYMGSMRPDEESFLDLHACEFLLAMEDQVIPAISPK